MNLVYLFIVSFVQNMAFTWVSRSRNGGDLSYHAWASIWSNMIWFACNFFLIVPEVMKSIDEGDITSRILTMLVYTAGTALGSVVMMAINLGRIKNLPKFLSFLVETGKRQVGSK